MKVDDENIANIDGIILSYGFLFFIFYIPIYKWVNISYIFKNRTVLKDTKYDNGFYLCAESLCSD